LGRARGRANTTGLNNAFFGAQAGRFNTTGEGNTFVGSAAGSGNTIGDNNTLVGGNSNVGANNLTYATAIGAGAVVTTSNTIVLGRSNFQDRIRLYGLGSPGLTLLCRNASLEISTYDGQFTADPAAKNEILKTLREQETRLDAQAEQIRQQQSQIELLKRLVCAQNKEAAICIEENK
jgi:hypothetical protein